ncbi:MAG: tetratricopeptide repeat protein [Planctomycetia bacterium]|nr:tetratricopeptide repeat protein [Planctomycetia bacterium]
MADESSDGGRKPLTPAQRKRLQQCFVHAGKQAAQDNFDYATELFTQCVLGDVNNSVYWQSFFGNLRKKYADNKKGAKLASIWSGKHRATVKKCQMQKDHFGVIRNGVEVVKLNPWDAHTLMAMAAAGEALELDEVPLIFLRSALDAGRKDPEVNRQAGHALRRRRQFMQAKACWIRVLEAKPDDDEAKHEMSELTVEEMMDRGGYDAAATSRDVAVDKDAAQAKTAAREEEISPERKLERAIQKDPSDMGPYLELAEVYFHQEDYGKAEKVLTRGYEASGKDTGMLERVEDARFRRLRKRLHDTRAEMDKTGSEEAKKQWREAKQEYEASELDAAKNRCQRYPNNLYFKFQLGLSYQRAGQFKEAIQQYQQARTDPRSKGECLLRLGQCFQQIKQFGLATKHYDDSLEELGEQTSDIRKEALHCAGKLALGLNDLDMAERHLTALAGLDFGYKDVSALLDKIAELRDTK